MCWKLDTTILLLGNSPSTCDLCRSLHIYIAIDCLRWNMLHVSCHPAHRTTPNLLFNKLLLAPVDYPHDVARIPVSLTEPSWSPHRGIIPKQTVILGRFLSPAFFLTSASICMRIIYYFFLPAHQGLYFTSLARNNAVYRTSTLFEDRTI